VNTEYFYLLRSDLSWSLVLKTVLTILCDVRVLRRDLYSKAKTTVLSIAFLVFLLSFPLVLTPMFYIHNQVVEKPVKLLRRNPPDQLSLDADFEWLA